MHIGHVLRQHRVAARLTQEQAAARAGLTRNTILALEKAALPDPHLSTLLSLMRAYGAGSLDEMLGPMPSGSLAEHWLAAGWVGGRPNASGA